MGHVHTIEHHDGAFHPRFATVEHMVVGSEKQVETDVLNLKQQSVGGRKARITRIRWSSQSDFQVTAGKIRLLHVGLHIAEAIRIIIFSRLRIISHLVLGCVTHDVACKKQSDQAIGAISLPFPAFLFLPFRLIEHKKGTQHNPNDQYERQLMKEGCRIFEFTFHKRKERRPFDLRSLRSGRDSNSRPPA